MMKSLRTLLPLLLLTALPAAAQDWSLGIGTGAFVFGDFAERRLRVAAGPDTDVQTLILSAATRPGLAVDIGHQFSERWSLRLEGAFTRAPLEVQDESDEGVELDAGEMNVTTLILPLVFHINTGGTFRFHIMGGPAYAMYNIEEQTRTIFDVPIFEGTRNRFGGAFGGGIEWRFSDRFGIEGQIVDIVTDSPFEEEDLGGDRRGLDISETHNVHTTVGIRYRF